MTDVLVRIELLGGAANNRAYTQTYDYVRCTLLPARAELLALYENAPVGQTYEFMVTNNKVLGVPDQSKIVITNPQVSGFCKDDTFIVLATTQRTRLGGRMFLTGLCYKTE